MNEETPQPDEQPTETNPSLAASGETPEAEGAETAEGSNGADSEILDALRQVVDPELMINVVDLGLVYGVKQEGPKAEVEMTLTSPACPAGPQIVHQAKMAVERLESVDEAEIKLVMTPPWSPERMTDDARDQLGIF